MCFLDRTLTMRVCVIFISGLLISIKFTTGAQKYVGSRSSCEESQYQPCHPLMWYVNQTQNWSRTDLIFLEGEHILSNNVSTSVSDLKMIGIGTIRIDSIDGTPSPMSKVVCKANGGFLFFNSSNVSIESLSFESCGVDTNIVITGGHPLHVQAAVTFHSCYDISLTSVLVEDSSGYGLAVINTRGDFHTSGSVFMRSKLPSNDTSKQTGNAAFWFEDCHSNCTSGSAFVSIENSFFLHGDGGPIIKSGSDGTGLSLLVYQPLVNVTLKNITAKNNSGLYGANIAIKILIFDNETSKVDIQNSSIELGTGFHGSGGLYIQLNYDGEEVDTCVPNDSVTDDIVSLSNTVFNENHSIKYGGAVLIHHHEQRGRGSAALHIDFYNCTFINNSAPTGAAVYITKYGVPVYKSHIVPQLTVQFEMCFVAGNFLTNCSKHPNEDGIFKFSVIEAITIQDCTFTENHGTGLLIIDSTIVFKNYTLFQGNSAVYGGAIKVCDRSLLFLREGVHIKFQDNSASVAGGAIYAGGECQKVFPPCFFQPDVNTHDISELGSKINLEFINNTAMIAGTAIYGGSIDNCYTYNMFAINGTSEPSYYNSFAIYKAIFRFPDSSSNVSRVTSDPYGVCVCDPQTMENNCTTRVLPQKEMFPGEWFNISVTAVGQTDSSVPALISVDNVKENNCTINLSRNDPYVSQTIVTDLCQTIHLAVLSKTTNATLVLTVLQSNPVSEQSTYFNLPLELPVSLTPCPRLFQLNETYGCDCHHLLKNTTQIVKCDINSLTISKPQNIWIGCISTHLNSSEDPQCDLIGVSNHCSEHCSKNSNLNFTISDLDKQCVTGRTGRVCGRCDANHTLSLGKPECLDNNSYCSIWKTFIFLFIFVLAGLLFVCFLTIFNFTVSEGTVNGLLFYANLVHANDGKFFRGDASNWNPCRIFISWLNLDFGFVVCFYTGMDVYQKVWLEFVFLLYLLLLGLLIIYSSHKFICVTRLVGRNVVSVLSTIILFSYSKLVHTSVKALKRSTLKVSDHLNNEESILVWRKDSNIDYFKGKHIPLAVVAIFLCIIAFLYTLCLMFIQCLQRRSSWRILRWVDKLRPFFDANTGPCRDHHRFWPGFLLFVRFALLLVYGMDVVNNEYKLYFLLGFSVIVFFLAFVSPNGVYRKWPLNILEFSFFLNLGLLSALVVLFKNVPTRAFTFPSIGISVITFACILLFHSYKRVSGTRKCKQFVAWVLKRCGKRQPFSILQEQVRDNQRDIIIDTEDVNERTPIVQRAPPCIHFDRLRESLLSDSQQS